jgi:hypothetical protein
MRNDAIHPMRRAIGRTPGLPDDGLHDRCQQVQPVQSITIEKFIFQCTD